jgi:hypothetical protein
MLTRSTRPRYCSSPCRATWICCVALSTSSWRIACGSLSQRVLASLLKKARIAVRNLPAIMGVVRVRREVA